MPAIIARAPHVLDRAESAAFTVALEEISTAAFVVWADGRIACSSRSGRAACERAPSFVASGLIASMRGLGGAFRVTRILVPGAPDHFLAVQVGGAIDPGPRLAAATARHGFTPRQAQVAGESPSDPGGKGRRRRSSPAGSLRLG